MQAFNIAGLIVWQALGLIADFGQGIGPDMRAGAVELMHPSVPVFVVFFIKTFLQGGAIRSRGREARYAAKRRDYELLDIGNRVRQEVISSWESYQASKAQTESRKDEIEAAQLALRGVREEARIGQRSVLDILDADQEMIEARISLVRAKYAENLALFTLLGNLGLLNMGVLSAENTPMEIGLQSP